MLHVVATASSAGYTVIGVVALVVWIGSMIATPMLASRKGRSGVSWFFLALFFSVIALVAVLLVSDSGTGSTRCPNCRATVGSASTICPNCKMKIGGVADFQPTR